MKIDKSFSLLFLPIDTLII